MDIEKKELKRPRHVMPDFIIDELENCGLMKDFNARPPYQRNDYIGWINSAKQQATKKKRLAQMMEELDLGGVYMKMPHPASSKTDGPKQVQKQAKCTNRDGSAEVDKYLQSLSREVRELLNDVRRNILKSAPGCTERIAYGMPVFRFEKDLCGIQAHKNFCSFYTMDKQLPSELKKRFPEIEISSSTIRFYPERPLPEEVTASVVRSRLQAP